MKEVDCDSQEKSLIAVSTCCLGSLSDVWTRACKWIENCGGRIGNGLNHFHTAVQMDLEYFSLSLLLSLSVRACFITHMCMHACLLCYSDNILSDFVWYVCINISTHSKLFSAILPASAHPHIPSRLELFTFFLFFSTVIIYLLKSHAKFCLTGLWYKLKILLILKLQNWDLR